MHTNDAFTRHMILSYLKSTFYWYERFKVSRDTEHLDCAERFAEVVKSYLPNACQNWSVMTLCNLCLTLLDQKTGEYI